MFPTPFIRLLPVLTGLVLSQNVAAAENCSDPNAAQNKATFVSQDIPNRLESGKTYKASVTMRNDGCATWSAAQGYRMMATAYMPEFSDILYLGPNDSIAPQQTGTFHFTITAPVNNSGTIKRYDFLPLTMFREGSLPFGETSTKFGTEVFYAPNLATSRPLRYPLQVISPSDPAFKAGQFRGTNIIIQDDESKFKEELIAQYQKEMIEAARAEMIQSAKAAADMKLTHIRYHLVIPSDNQPNLYKYTMAKTDLMLDIAYKYGLKSMVVLVGYNGLTTQCGYRFPLNHKLQNTATMVRRYAAHPGVFAWDLSNEPMWEASIGNCLNANSTSAIDARYQDVVDGVHEMYNIVRENDPTNKPTTVGDYPAPFLKYWKDISSFVAPHFYVETNPGSPDFRQLRSVINNTIDQYRLETAGRALVLGEFGFEIGANVPDEAAQATAYQTFYDVARAKDVGSMSWLVSTNPIQRPWSIVRTDGSWKPAANVVATQVGETRDAAFVGQTVPSVMTRGMLHNVSITLTNTGTTTWYQAGYKLAAVDPAVEAAWGVPRVELSSAPIEAIFPGQSKSFNFSVRAPSTPGTYNFHWQMLQEGVTTFGPVTPNVAVTVR